MSILVYAAIFPESLEILTRAKLQPHFISIVGEIVLAKPWKVLGRCGPEGWSWPELNLDVVLVKVAN